MLHKIIRTPILQRIKVQKDSDDKLMNIDYRGPDNNGLKAKVMVMAMGRHGDGQVAMMME